ncbi:ARM repeat-containing protein, partial [Coemansia reversa NRRL 1564]
MELKGRVEPGRGPVLGGRPPSGQFRGPGGGRESRGGRSGGRGRGRARGRGGSQQGGDRPGAAVELPVNFKPLEKSENRYIAKALRVGSDTVEDEMQEEVYDRRIRVLLNKITPDNFDEVSDELLAWGGKSAKETDGRILRHLITLVFQKATDEPVWAKMYAQLCHKMICHTSPDVEDRNLRTKEGGYLSGGFLVRKYLLTKCQEDFEHGWKVEIPMDIESSEYYEAIKIKRRGLGLVKFIGELFLFDVLTLRIMHECVKRLLSNVETPEEEETESLAKLLTTVGSKLDVPNARSYMDVYFVRIQTMSTNKHLTSRIRFMLRDLIELRQKNWVTRIEEAGPKTIAEIHEDAERKK